MNFLFHLKNFNDIDHITPVIWKFLDRGEEVTAIFLSQYDFENDYRINFLLSYPRFRVIRADKIQFIRKKIFGNRYYKRIIGNHWPSFVEYVWPNPLLSKDKYSALIYDWGSPNRLNHYDAILRGIPAIVLPHGFNIF